MRLEYVLAGLLAMGCTTSPFSETKPSVVQPIQFDKPRPSANIRSYETLTLTPEQNISITVTDVAERRSIRDIHMYFLPEGKQGIALHIAGSPLELEKKGTSHFCWYAGEQFNQLPEGKGRFILEIVGRETGTYDVPVTLCKYCDVAIR